MTSSRKWNSNGWIIAAAMIVPVVWPFASAQAGFEFVIGSDGLYLTVSHHDDPYDYYDAPVDHCGAVTSYSSFDATLSGHGSWRWVDSIGEELWFPYVAYDWRPYTQGHWIRTSHGMTWVAYEPWGWLPHHYGRWVFINSYGWGWKAGFEYGAAWVTWGVVDGYVGWAPLAPASFHYSTRRSYAYNGPRPHFWHGAHATYHRSGIDFRFWSFIPNRYFYDSPVYGHVVSTDKSVRFFNAGRVIPIGQTISIDYVRRVTPRNVRMVRTNEERYRIGQREMTHYRPIGQEQKIRKAEKAVRRVTSYKAPVVRTGGSSTHYRSGTATATTKVRQKIGRSGSDRLSRHEPVKRSPRIEKRSKTTDRSSKSAVKSKPTRSRDRSRSGKRSR